MRRWKTCVRIFKKIAQGLFLAIFLDFWGYTLKIQSITYSSIDINTINYCRVCNASIKQGLCEISFGSV